MGREGCFRPEGKTLLILHKSQVVLSHSIAGEHDLLHSERQGQDCNNVRAGRSSGRRDFAAGHFFGESQKRC